MKADDPRLEQAHKEMTERIEKYEQRLVAVLKGSKAYLDAPKSRADILESDWLRLAHDYVAQNAGSVTAGCDGIDMALFDEDLEGNLQHLAERHHARCSQARPGNGRIRVLLSARPGGRQYPGRP